MGGGGTSPQQAGNGSMAQMGQQGVGMPGGAQGVQGMGLQSMMSMQAAGGQQQSNPFTASSMNATPLMRPAGNPFTASGNPFTASPAQSTGTASSDPFAGLQGTMPKQTSMQATPGFAPAGTSSFQPFKMPAMPQFPAMAAQAAAPAPAPVKYPVPPNAHAVSSPTIAGHNNLGNYYAAPSGLPVDAQGNIIQHFAKINNIHDFLSANSNVAKAPTYTYDKNGKLTTS